MSFQRNVAGKYFTTGLRGGSQARQAFLFIERKIYIDRLRRSFV